MESEIQRWRDAALAAQKRVAELEQALEPFASVSLDGLPGFLVGIDPTDVFLWRQQSNVREERGISVAHILKAQEVLGK